MQKSIKRVLRDAIRADFMDQCGDVIYGTQVVTMKPGQALEATHIRITTPTATLLTGGSDDRGHWQVDVELSASASIDSIGEDEYDNLVGILEAYIMQDQATLASSITDDDVKVVTIKPEGAAEAAMGKMQHSTIDASVRCYMKG